MDKCPTCKKKFNDITEYPYVRIVSVQVTKPNEVPETVSDWYEKSNYAPQIRELLEQNKALKQYLNGLEQLVGKTVPTSHVLPSWEKTGLLRVYKIPDSDLLLDLSEREKQNDCRTFEIDLMGKGANSGSLSVLLAIAQIEYKGAISEN